MRHLAVPETWFLLVAISLIVAGLAVGAIHLSFHGSWLDKLRKATGIALVVGGAFAVWSYTLAPKQKLPYILEDEAAAFAQARAEGKGVMIDFSASWCVPCAELELTFADPDVYEMITKNFVPLKFDVSNGDDVSSERQKRYDAETLPSVVFKSAEPVEANRHTVGRIDRMMGPDDLKALLGPAIQKLHSGNTLAASEPCH
jgi:thiol:disulfide interchange protein DsbD